MILPVHRGESYVKRSIESILDQTFEDLELIVISEHGSGDRQLSIIDGFSDDRLRHILNRERLGLVGSLNLGLGLAEGDLIGRMDADDISDPSRFQVQIDFLERNDEVGIVGSHARLIDQDGKGIGQTRSMTSIPKIRMEMNFKDIVLHPSILARHEILSKTGGYNEEALYCEDYELWLRALEFCEIAILPDVLLTKRVHEKRVSNEHHDAQSANSIEVSRRHLSNMIGLSLTTEEVRDLRFPYQISTRERAEHTSELLILIMKKTNQRYVNDRRSSDIVRLETIRRISQVWARSSNRDFLNYFRGLRASIEFGGREAVYFGCMTPLHMISGLRDSINK